MEPGVLRGRDRIHCKPGEQQCNGEHAQRGSDPLTRRCIKQHVPHSNLLSERRTGALEIDNETGSSLAGWASCGLSGLCLDVSGLRHGGGSHRVPERAEKAAVAKLPSMASMHIVRIELCALCGS